MWTRMTTALERILVTEREPRRTDETNFSGFAVPGLIERPLDVDQEPLLSTNMRRSFVPTVVSRVRKTARCGLSECLPEEESELLAELWRVAWALSLQNGWHNRCTSLPEAAARMRSQGIEPRSLVVPYSLVEQVSGQALTREEANNLMVAQGFVTEAKGVQVLVADIPDGKAFMVASPVLAGFYTRVDDRLGVLLTRVPQTLMLIDGLA